LAGAGGHCGWADISLHQSRVPRQLTGTAGPDESQQFPIQTGKIDGNKVVLEISPSEGAVYHMELVLDGDHLKGDMTAKRDDGTMTAKLDVSRAK
jgi:hypothetical protein